MRSGSAFRLLVCISLVLLASRIAAASTIHVVINDPDLGQLEALFISGSGTFDVSVLPPFTVVQPGVGQLGEVENHFEYLSADPRVAPGQSLTWSYNLFEEPLFTTLSDTLTVTLTGHTATPGNNTNVTLDLFFRSISLDHISPPALPNAVDLFEHQALEFIFGHHYLRLSGGPGDFEVDVASGVPEPGTMTLLGLGVAGVLGRYARSRRIVSSRYSRNWLDSLRSKH